MSDLPLRLMIVTRPTCEPVSVAEAKLHARIDEDADNGKVQDLIYAAREMAEIYTRRAFITQTWKMFLDAWPCEPFDLPKAPLQSVTSIKTYDDSDAATTLAVSNYYVDVATRPGRVAKRSSATWPTPARVANGIEVQFICGYGDKPSDVPLQIRQAILETVAHLYEHRGDASVEMPATAFALLGSHKDWLV